MLGLRVPLGGTPKIPEKAEQVLRLSGICHTAIKQYFGRHQIVYIHSMENKLWARTVIKDLPCNCQVLRKHCERKILD